MSVGLESLGVLHGKVAAHNLCRALETFPPTGDMGWDDDYVGGGFMALDSAYLGLLTWLLVNMRILTHVL